MSIAPCLAANGITDADWLNVKILDKNPFLALQAGGPARNFLDFLTRECI